MGHSEAFPAGPGHGRAGSPVMSPSGMSEDGKRRGNKRSCSLGCESLPWCFTPGPSFLLGPELSHPEGAVMSHCPLEPCPRRRSQGSEPTKLPQGLQFLIPWPFRSLMAIAMKNDGFHILVYFCYLP